MKEFVNTVLVTNHAAERGIKITSEYIKILTKDHTEQQNLLQTVEFTRKKWKKMITVQSNYITIMISTRRKYIFSVVVINTVFILFH